MRNTNPDGRDAAGDPKTSSDQLDAYPGAAGTEGRVASFAFDGQTVRTVVEEGRTWFVAADVCAVLDHTNPSRAVSRLDDDEKGLTTAHTLGGGQEVLTVSESGLYALVLTSRKPQARAFRRWITGEVLPALRATGRYDANDRAGVEAPQPRLPLTIELPGYGRFVVYARSNGRCDVRATGYDAMMAEATNVDVRIMCHQLGVIEGFWHKYRLLRSLPVETEGGFALGELEAAILKGGQLSHQYLSCYAELGAVTLPVKVGDAA